MAKRRRIGAVPCTATDVAFNSRNPNQLIANIYIEKDAGDADIEVHSASGLATVSKDQQKIIDELRKMQTDAKNQGDGLYFSVLAKEKAWVTVFGPLLTDDLKLEYKKGNYEPVAQTHDRAVVAPGRISWFAMPGLFLLSP